jgi:hypothetical protein
MMRFILNDAQADWQNGFDATAEEFQPFPRKAGHCNRLEYALGL